jgi:hypothetical protein
MHNFRTTLLLLVSLAGVHCLAQPISSQSQPSESAVAAAQQRVLDCTRTLPILVQEASIQQIQQACQDKYGLEGSYVNTCLTQIRQIYTAEGKSFPLDDLAIRGQCSARERIAGITRQPFDAPEVVQSKPTDAASLIWPMGGDVVDGFKEGGDVGIGITGFKGATVVAAADGTVVGLEAAGLFNGSRLLIRSAALFTAYANFGTANVRRGDAVSQGQKIAEMGDDKKLFFKVFTVVSDRKIVALDTLKSLPTR